MIMETTTKYDTIINFFLDNWIIAIIVVIAVVIGFIPSLRDGMKQICDIIKVFFQKKEFVVEYKDEKITFEIMLQSQYFDVVKIFAVTHVLGVHAEREWIKKYYPDYSWSSQSLSKVKIKEGVFKCFDIIDISNGHNKKQIYFDISAFFNDAGCTSTNVNRFARDKIEELYRSKKNN